MSRTELTFTPTTRETCFSVFAIDDDVALEGEETVILILTGPDSVIITNSVLEVTIIDTDGMCRNVIKCDINNVTLFINKMLFLLHFYAVVTFGFSQKDRVSTEGEGVITVEIERDRETQNPIKLVVSSEEYSVVNGTISFLPFVGPFNPFNPNTATGMFYWFL